MRFSLSKFKVELKLSVNRLRLLQAKKSSLNAKARREIATLLESGKERSAYIRVENIIREDFNVEALEIVELYCELLTARVGLIEQSRTVDPGISEAVWSIVYASTRADVRELVILREMLISKFGAEAVKSAIDNAEGQVDPKLMRKLSPQAPPTELVKMYLKEIASVYRVNWRPEGENDDSNDTPSGGVKEPARLATPPVAFECAELDDLLDEGTDPAKTGDSQNSTGNDTDKDKEVSDFLPSVPPKSENPSGSDSAAPKSPITKPLAPKPTAKLPVPVVSRAKPSAPALKDGLPSLDELQRRFDALKRV
ncbi:Vacuolar protein sorting-associated protein ist1 [Kickxella alabastrina]|uniref:Vacuolar protein sorting-associated protein ist1 n=1 Tax=Kickxella alabastrina TaxID=61397 RepID=A0ACC1IF12_9FUNG|nr:Vacuolar protein sorting-associated protein ist1 [Kickxella alabastrina]